MVSAATPEAVGGGVPPGGWPRELVLLTDGEQAKLWSRRALLISVAVGAIVAMAELDRVLGSLPDATGRVASIGRITGFGAWSNRELWQVWFAAEGRSNIAAGIVWYAVIDLAFIICYSFLLIRLAKPVNLPNDLATTATRRATWGAVCLTIGFDVLESLILLLLAAGVTPQAQGFWTTTLAVVALGKWFGLGFTVVFLFCVRPTRQALIRLIKALVWGIKLHRLAVIFLVILAGLALVPSGQAVFDQIPDVQRRWFVDLTEFWRQGALVVVLMGFVSVAFWVLGRRRSTRALHLLAEAPEPTGTPDHRWWVAPPLLVIFGTLLVWKVSPLGIGWLTGLGIVSGLATYGLAKGAQKLVEGWPEPAFWRLNRGEAWLGGLSVVVAAGFTVMCRSMPENEDLNVNVPTALTVVWAPIIVMVVSMFLNGTGSANGQSNPIATTRFMVRGAPRDLAEKVPRAVATTRVGDLIAVFALGLSSLSLVRSAVAPAFASGFYPGDSTGAADLALAGSWLVLGAVTAMLIPPAAVYLVHGIDRMLLQPSTAGSWARVLFDPTETPTAEPAAPADPKWLERLDSATFLTGAAMVVAALLWPDSVGDSVGPIGVTIGLLAGWFLLVSATIMSMQRSAPLAIFQVLGLRSTPNITIILALMVGTSTFFNPVQLHAVRVLDTGRSAAAFPKESWALELVGRWVEREKAPTRADGCLLRRDVRPLLMIVAEGGGARAAYWTAKAMEALSDPASPLCGSALIASGISGGSVGLMVHQAIGNPGGTEASTAVSSLTSQNALARAVAGLLGGDLVAGLTGVRVPTGGSWVDRAGHLEQGWVDATGGQSSPLDQPMPTTAGPGKPSLVLNSVDAVSGCRVLVAQDFMSDLETVVVDPKRKTLTPSDCDGPGAAGPGTLSLNQIYPNCSAQLRRATAAMLSARFPIVTPGGRFPSAPCGTTGGPEVQLVDGGYSDPSGLSTMAELAPALVAEITRQNDQAIACRSPNTASAGCHRFVIQPIVVFLKNSPGYGLADAERRLATELLVPLSGLGARDVQVSEATWLQRLHTVTGDVCNWSPGKVATGEEKSCATEVKKLNEVRTVVIAPQTAPAPPPPLGWTLSRMSMAAMANALDSERTCAKTSKQGARTWSSLCDLQKASKGE